LAAISKSFIFWFFIKYNKWRSKW